MEIFSTKTHAACDSLGSPIRFICTSGQTLDYKEALSLIEGLRAKAILADKGYDANYIIEVGQACRSQLVIPPRSK